MGDSKMCSKLNNNDKLELKLKPKLTESTSRRFVKYFSEATRNLLEIFD